MSGPVTRVEAPWILARVQSSVAAAKVRDSEGAFGPLIEIGRRFGAPGGFLACAGLAQHVCEVAGWKRNTPNDYLVFEVEDLRHGIVPPEQVEGPQGQAIVAALRFCMAYANDDADMAAALFEADNASLDGGGLGAGLVALVAAFANPVDAGSDA